VTLSMWSSPPQLPQVPHRLRPSQPSETSGPRALAFPVVPREKGAVRAISGRPAPPASSGSFGSEADHSYTGAAFVMSAPRTPAIPAITNAAVKKATATSARPDA
jgi:hypothetical protein